MARRRSHHARRRRTQYHSGLGDLGGISQRTALIGVLAVGGIGALAAVALSSSRTPGGVLYRPPVVVPGPTAAIREYGAAAGAAIDIAGNVLLKLANLFGSHTTTTTATNTTPPTDTSYPDSPFASTEEVATEDPEALAGLRSRGLGSFDTGLVPSTVARAPRIGSRARARWVI